MLIQFFISHIFTAFSEDNWNIFKKVIRAICYLLMKYKSCTWQSEVDE